MENGCPNTEDKRHEWAMFPVGPDGRLIANPSIGRGSAAMFCRFCMTPQPPQNELEKKDD